MIIFLRKIWFILKLGFVVVEKYLGLATISILERGNGAHLGWPPGRFSRGISVQKSLLFQHAGKTTFVNVIASGQFNEVELKLIVWKLVLGYDSHSGLLHECHLYCLIFVFVYLFLGHDPHRGLQYEEDYERASHNKTVGHWGTAEV